ncbi:uncharacterized protein LOC126735401 [Anthonomus grandis grandis]|uniref:uncharacterized protein LOC126735401 n=1 Tax=Anthonomus grandis grandis TaxID=2921223 RepID=UPI0021659C30|nr:uncharacterized protein LOC126735401 [Anthonomus grandis grandis]
MSENFKVPEPEWILDKNGNGHLIWRRDIEDKDSSRVKFKHDVEIKEFHRKSYELMEPPWTQEIDSPNIFSMSFTCLVCVTISLVIPWYILSGAIY